MSGAEEDVKVDQQQPQGTSPQPPVNPPQSPVNYPPQGMWVTPGAVHSHRAAVGWLIVVVALLAIVVAAEGVVIWHVDQRYRHERVLVRNLRSHRQTPSHSALSQAIPGGPGTLGAGLAQSNSPGDAFEDLRQLEATVDQSFDRMLTRMESQGGFSPAMLTPRGETSPALDLIDQGNQYVIKMDLPGTDLSRVHIKVEHNVVTVSGTREQTQTERSENGRIVRQERSEGAFLRSLTLPGPVNSAGMQTEYKEGVLTITLPKSKSMAGTRGQRIQLD